VLICRRLALAEAYERPVTPSEALACDRERGPGSEGPGGAAFFCAHDAVDRGDGSMDEG